MGDLIVSSFIRRIIAAILDILFIMVFGAVIGQVLGFGLAQNTFPAFIKDEPGWAYFPSIQGLLVIPSGITWLWLLIGVVEVFGLATPGKFLLGLRIRSVNGEFSDYQKRLIRTVLKYFLPITSLIAGFTGLLWIASAGQIVFLIVLSAFVIGKGFFGQTLHDLVSKTQVFRV